LLNFSVVKNRRRIKAFSPQRRKERKGRQEIWTCLVLLSVLSVFVLKILGFGGFEVPLLLAFLLNTLGFFRDTAVFGLSKVGILPKDCPVLP